MSDRSPTPPQTSAKAKQTARVLGDSPQNRDDSSADRPGGEEGDAKDKKATHTTRVNTNEKPEKPNGSDFQQQKLSHFYAQHNAPSTIICLFVVAFAFIPIGATIIVASDSITEIDVRYDHVNNYNYRTCSHNINTYTSGALTASNGCRVRKTFTISQTIKAPVYLYYRLVNFYQNYRQYAKSVNEHQLQGESSERGDMGDCSPFLNPGEFQNDVTPSVTISGSPVKYAEMQYAPCGAIAWSMFNDTISLYKITDGTRASVEALLPGVATPGSLICNGGAFNTSGHDTGATQSKCTKKGIAFPTDVDTRFKTPFKSKYVWSGEGNAASSDDYQKAGWYAREIGHKIPVQTDEDFIVWSRIAGLKDFRKLYRRIDVDLAPGDYAFDVTENFDVASFQGEKHMLLATTSWVGGTNYILGGLFITFGCISIVFGIAFLCWYMFGGRDEILAQTMSGTLISLSEKRDREAAAAAAAAAAARNEDEGTSAAQ